jgi:hypothetical protein
MVHQGIRTADKGKAARIDGAWWLAWAMKPHLDAHGDEGEAMKIRITGGEIDFDTDVPDFVDRPFIEKAIASAVKRDAYLKMTPKDRERHKKARAAETARKKAVVEQEITERRVAERDKTVANFLSDPKTVQIVAMREQGQTKPKIAETVGVKVARVARVLERVEKYKYDQLYRSVRNLPEDSWQPMSSVPRVDGVPIAARKDPSSGPWTGLGIITWVQAEGAWMIGRRGWLWKDDDLNYTEWAAIPGKTLVQ